MKKFLTILLSALALCDASYKRWLPNTDFNNGMNWDAGRLPCGNDKVIIQDESPVVYLQINTTIRELVLPRSGEIVLGSNVNLAFTDQADHSANCLDSGREIQFNVTHAADWVDPLNWCDVLSETGDCVDSYMLDSEKIPCASDNVIFDRQHSYFVNLGTQLKFTIGTLKISGRRYTTNSFREFLKSSSGRGMFPSSITSDQSQITIERQGCKDPTGCVCGNNMKQILAATCKLQSPRCFKPRCLSPIRPIGGCCDICGAILHLEYGTGFRFSTLRDGLKRNFLEKTAQINDINYVVSKVDDRKVQVVLSDTTGESSVNVANRIKDNLQADIDSGGFRYMLTSVVLETSGGAHTPGTAKLRGHDNTSSGEIAGIVVGLALVLVAALIASLFVYRRKLRPSDEISFRMFDKLSFKKNTPKPRVEVPPSIGFSFGSPENIGAAIGQGFDNPMYGSVLPEHEKTLEFEMTPTQLDTEQPTFDGSRGFDNPLYDTHVQESFFVDPTKVKARVTLESTVEAHDDTTEA